MGIKKIFSIKFLGIFIILIICNFALYIMSCNNENDYDSYQTREEYINLINEKIENINNHLGTSLVESKSEDYYKLLKTRYDLLKIKEVKIQQTKTKSFSEFSNFTLNDKISIIIIVMFVLFIGRPEEDFLDLISTTKKSKRQYNINNIFAIFLLVIVSVIMNFGLLIMYSFLKNKDIRTLMYAVQNAYSWCLSGSITSIRNELVLICLGEILKLFVIGLLMYLLINILKSRSLKLLIISMALVIEFIFFNFVNTNKISTILKTVNIFKPVSDLYKDYGLIGIGKYWIEIYEFYNYSLIFLMIALLLISINFHYEYKKLVLSNVKNKLNCTYNCILLELKKILIMQNNLSFILMIIVIVLSINLTSGGYISEEDIEIKQYYKAVNGDYEEKTDDFINECDKTIALYEKIKDEIGGSGDYISDLSRYKKLKERVERIQERLKNLSDEGMINLKVLDEIKFNNIFNTNGNTYTTILMILNLIAIAFISVGSNTFEKRNETKYLIRTTRKGKSQFLIKTYIIKLAIIILLTIGINLIWYETITKTYALKDYELSASIRSLTLFESFGFDISVRNMFISMVILRLLIGILLSILLISLSYICSDLWSYGIGALIILVSFLKPVQTTVLRYVSIVDYYIGTKLFTGKYVKLSILILFVVLFMLDIILIRKAIKKWTID